MRIDREYLEATMSNLRRQEQEATDMANKARGAILLTEALLSRLEQEEPITGPPALAVVSEPAASGQE